MPEDFRSLFDLGLDLFRGHNYRGLAALLIFGLVKFGGPFLAKKFPFFATSKGKVSLVVALAVANGLFQAFKPGSVPSLSVLSDAILAAVSAAGGFSLMKPFMPEEKPAEKPSVPPVA